MKSDWQNHVGNDAALETPFQPIRVTSLDLPQPLVEATGWMVRDDGTVELIADDLGLSILGATHPSVTASGL